MLTFLLKRLFQVLIVMFVISLVAFSIQDNLGDPLRELVGQSVSEEVRQQMRTEMGLNDPFLVKYGRFIGNALQGDFGTSYFYKQPTLEVIFEKLPATLELVFCASVLIIALSIPLGVYSAIKPHAFLSRAVMGISIIGISVPVFLTAILLMYVFSIELGWLPAYGRGELTSPLGWESGLFNWQGFRNLILPSVALSSIMLPLFIRLVRSEMLEQLSAEYVKFAWAKGLDKYRIWFIHALKNTLLPLITVGGANRYHGGLHHTDRNRVSVAGHRPAVSRRHQPGGYAPDHHLCDFCRLYLCGDQHHRRFDIRPDQSDR
jgi:peptide/nickel transport system permease protein